MEDSVPSDNSTELVKSNVPEDVGDALKPQNTADSDDEVLMLPSLLPNTDFAMVSTTFLFSHQINSLKPWVLRCPRLLEVFQGLRMLPTPKVLRRP